jgi:hypothetical protein
MCVCVYVCMCVCMYVCMCVCVCVCVYVCSLIVREQINRFAPNFACLFFRPARDFRKVKTPENVSRVPVPVRVVPVPRKLITLKEQ